MLGDTSGLPRSRQSHTSMQSDKKLWKVRKYGTSLRKKETGKYLNIMRRRSFWSCETSFLPPFMWVLVVTCMLILNNILWSCGNVTSDWAGDYVHMKHLGACWKCKTSVPTPGLLNQKLNFSGYPVIYIYIDIWEALVWKHLMENKAWFVALRP